MRERVVFVPIGFLRSISGGVRTVPALKTLLTELESHFEVIIPVKAPESESQLKGYPFDAQPPSPPESWPRDIRRALTEDSHMVAMGWHTPEVLVALDRMPVRSFVSLGFQPTPAMLRTAGMAAAADAYEGALLRFRTQGTIRMLFQGMDEDACGSLVDDIGRNIDPARQHAYMDWLNALDPLKDRPAVVAPTLYLHSPLDMGQARDIFRQLVPHAELGDLESFPMRLQEADTGIEPARKTIEFVKRHAA